MKMIGLIGGMSWQSTRVYYDLLNEAVAAARGGLHSAEILMRSVDFADLEAAMRRGDWQMIEARLGDEAAALASGGADCLLLCTNTMHKMFDGIAARVDVPFFHIADTLGQALAADGLTRIGLLGTRFTMVEDFYAARLQARFGVETLLPEEAQIAAIDRIIFEELCRGEVRDGSRDLYLDIIDDLAARGAEGIILGCTEIEMLIKPHHHHLPLYDTTKLHALHAVQWALADGSSQP
ncbi:MAG TPA: aspartate/glutamate racemase [Alphaproteobacteria bacterium]|nr:MAG: aspartate/glutamate racemase [SAR116 cluster bacterium MED-G06]HCV88946.1 aspartate/glutamate racemase [Alphaproteobacteria bacterium]|tara:strand:- start:701 stop:1411 length:711 start_codon:yes stop_codon:yes gene_type:complete